jgi:hypothetical protein
MDTNLVKISSLMARYGLESRQSVYARLKALKITPVARGKINLYQLQLLDKLDKHIRQNKTMAEFPLQPEVQVTPLDKLEYSDNELDNNENLAVINALANLIEKLAIALPNNEKSPLQHYRELEEAMNHQWVIKTSTVSSITGARKPKSPFHWGGFTFINVGRNKLGMESGWIVTKDIGG